MNDDSTDISSLNTSRLQQHNGSFAQDHVDPITITANDAILTKLSTSQMGYYNDPFLPFLAKDAVGLTSSSSAISTRSCLDKVSTRSPSALQRHDNLRPILKQQRTTQMHHPVIRRGTHARICVMDYAITNFLSLFRDSSHCRAGEQVVQIVILGSGRDTTYLRSQTRLLHTTTGSVGDCRNRSSSTGKSTGNRSSRSMLGKVKWYEVDHASVIENKHDLLCSCPLFDFDSETILGNSSSSKKEKSFKITPKRIVLEEGAACDHEPSTMHLIDSCPPLALDPYYLISYNLLHSFESLLQDMEQYHDFDRNVPTLFIMECLQMYLPQRNSCDILQTMTGTCRYPFITIFDPIIQNDSFGKVMAQNLTKARITDSSMSLLQTRTLKEQVDKLYRCGFENVTGCDFYGAYEMVLSMEDRQKANRLEMLDEIEEWILIMRHYCFLVGSTGGKIISSNVRDEDEEDEVGSIPIEAMLHAYCSVEEGNIFGFSKQKCMTTTTPPAAAAATTTTVAARKRRNS